MAIASKTVIVTGASRGIGLAIANFLIHEGHHVVVQARSASPLESLQVKFPKQVQIVVGDMTDLSLPKRVVDMALKEFKQLNGLVMNHGTLSPVTNIVDCDLEAWRKSFDVNFFSAVALAQAALPALRKTSGCILLTSSGAATSATSTWGAYGTSKAALNHLGRFLASEESDVTTIAIAPGVVDTDMQKELRDVHVSKMKEQDAARFIKYHEEGTLLKPEQPGNVMARVVLAGPKDLSGKYLRWNGEELAYFQDKQGALLA